MDHPPKNTITDRRGPKGARAVSVLVTGGAGFIGSHLARSLLARGDEVTIVDDLSTGRRENVPSDPRVRFVQGDLGAALTSELRGTRFDELYHLAAAVGVRLVVDRPIECIGINVDLTARVLEFARAGGASRVLIASSSEVYGKSDRCPFHEDDDVVYGPTTKRRWSYAMSKALDEHLALAYHQQHGVPVVIARLFNTVGPGQLGDYGMVLPNFVACARRGEPLRVFGDGLQTRCFCDVRDVSTALVRLLGEPTAHGRVFNIGSDRSISILALAQLVIRTLASRSMVELVPYDRAYAAGFEDLRRREPDLARVRAAIDFRPRVELETTIRDLATAMSTQIPSTVRVGVSPEVRA